MPQQPDALPFDESARVARLKHERDRHLRATAYVLRRKVISSERGFAAKDLRFDTTCLICGSREHGRPRLCAPPGNDLDFNVSHAGKIAAIAVTRAAAVGLDVENHEQLQRGWKDVQELVVQPDDDPSLNIWQFWTAKEAVLKLTGHGLALPMTSITLTRLPNGDSQALLQHEGVRQLAYVRWLDLDEEHTAALATPDHAQVTASRITL